MEKGKNSGTSGVLSVSLVMFVFIIFIIHHLEPLPFFIRKIFLMALPIDRENSNYFM